jgi:uncharacterized protein
MAEPRKEGRNNAALRSATVIVVRVVPRSSKVAISQDGPSSFKVRLTSPPVDGAANAQLLKILSEKLSLPVRLIRLISGEKAQTKRIGIEGLNLDQIAERLS